jgi:hypothetical protein
MQISNTTGESTTYRVLGSGSGANQGGTSDGGTATLELVGSGELDPLEEKEHCFNDSPTWMAEFYVGERLVASRSFDGTPAVVALAHDSRGYRVEAKML